MGIRKARARKRSDVEAAAKNQVNAKGSVKDNVQAFVNMRAKTDAQQLQAALDKIAEIVRAFTPPDKRRPMMPDSTAMPNISVSDLDRANISLLLQKLCAMKCTCNLVLLERRKAAAAAKERKAQAVKAAHEAKALESNAPITRSTTNPLLGEGFADER